MLVKHNNNFFFFTPLFILDILTKGYTSTVFQPKWIKEIVIRILEIIKRWIRLLDF